MISIYRIKTLSLRKLDRRVSDYTIELDFNEGCGTRFGFSRQHRPHKFVYCSGSRKSVSPVSCPPNVEDC